MQSESEIKTWCKIKMEREVMGEGTELMYLVQCTHENMEEEIRGEQ